MKSLMVLPVLVVIGGMACAAAEGTVTIASGHTLSLDAQSDVGGEFVDSVDGTRTSANNVILQGGTLDLNGHDLMLQSISMQSEGSIITNSSQTPVTLTCSSTDDQAFTGDIAGALTLVKTGNGGTWDFADATLQNTGMRVQGGDVSFTALAPVQANKFHLYLGKVRSGSGVQFSEFRLMLGNAIVPWPSGTVVTEGMETGSNYQNNIIDGSVDTKYYHPYMAGRWITITCQQDVSFDGYQFVTANDSTDRDLIAWRLDIWANVNGKMDWKILDNRADQQSIIPMARKTATPKFAVVGTTPSGNVLPDGYQLDVSAPARAVFVNAPDVLTNLSGDGLVDARGIANLTISGESTFAGRIRSERNPVAVAFESSTIPAIMPDSSGSSVINNGVAGAMKLSDAGSVTMEGALKDGTSPLGLTLSGNTYLMAIGAGSTYSGATTVCAGSTLFAGACQCARYFRYTPLKGTSGQNSNIQFSELQLVLGGEHILWPEGTQATTSGVDKPTEEGAGQLIDNNVNTKCYWTWQAQPVTVTTPKPVFFDGYRWFSANDSMGTRNPLRWKFAYSDDGVKWTVLDDKSTADVPTVSTTKTLAYTYSPALGIAPETDYLSDFSALALEDGGTNTLSAVHETIGSLTGAGTLRLGNSAVARLNVTEDSSFAGKVDGVGVLEKAGNAKQTLSGIVSLDGELVVSSGVFNLDNAVLSGITNIVLKGGVLTGTANVNGNVTVTSEGGAYGANLAIAGALTLSGTPKIATSFAGTAVCGTSFTFSSVDEASCDLFVQAVAAENLPKGWKLSFTAQATKLSWSLAQAGTVIILR